MIQSREIEDKKLYDLFYNDFKPYVEGLKSAKTEYTEKYFLGFRKKFKRLFEKYIQKKAKQLVAKKTEKYDLTKKDVYRDFVKTYLPGILATFDVSIDRAFGQAQHSIERNLKKDLTNPGFFGLRALFALKKMKMKKPGPIEGFSRFTKNMRIMNIDLVNYVFLLISTGQANLERKIEEIISFNTVHDLVWIDQHPCWLGPNADEVCNRWRGKIVSLHGLTVGFPEMRWATSEKPPLFHPNCTHSYHALTQEEANKAINNKIFLYKDL